MTLDKELLELDSRGIFPRCGESEDEYVERGWKVVRHSDCNDPLGYVIPLLEFFEWKNVSPAERMMVRTAVERVGRRFCCDVHWIDVYYAETDFPVEKSTLGFSLANKWCIEGGIERQIPPFVVLNRRSIVPHMPVLLHEIAHSVRELSEVNPHKGPEYVGDYEEMVADSAGNLWNWLVHWKLLFSSAMPTYLSARGIMGSFGDMADYTLIRSPYSDVVNMLKNNNPDSNTKIHAVPARDYICRMAEKDTRDGPALRYRIMKERLGL